MYMNSDELQLRSGLRLDERKNLSLRAPLLSVYSSRTLKHCYEMKISPSNICYIWRGRSEAALYFIRIELHVTCCPGTHPIRVNLDDQTTKLWFRE